MNDKDEATRRLCGNKPLKIAKQVFCTYSWRPGFLGNRHIIVNCKLESRKIYIALTTSRDQITQHLAAELGRQNTLHRLSLSVAEIPC